MAQVLSNYQHQPLKAARTSTLLSGSLLIHSAVIPRTLALMTTITMVAFALYGTQPIPSNQPSSQKNTNNIDPHTNTLKIKPEKHISSDKPSYSQVQSQVKQSSSSSSSNQTSVVVNGESIPVPADGNLHQTIKNGNSTTELNLSSSGNNSNSSTSINIQSDSSSSSNSGT
jgi:hypothetical protein